MEQVPKSRTLESAVPVMFVFNHLYVKHFSLVEYLLEIQHPSRHSIILNDDPENLKIFLQSMRVCVQEGQDLAPDARSLSYSSNLSQSVIVHHVISKLIHTKGPNSHVLAQGYRCQGQNSKGGNIIDMPHVENVYPNTMVSYVKSKLWQTLLVRIGDDIMTHLLQRLSVFIQSKSECYIQVSGLPVALLYRGLGKTVSRANLHTDKQTNETVKSQPETSKRKRPVGSELEEPSSKKPKVCNEFTVSVEISHTQTPPAQSTQVLSMQKKHTDKETKDGSKVQPETNQRKRPVEGAVEEPSSKKTKARNELALSVGISHTQIPPTQSTQALPMQISSKSGLVTNSNFRAIGHEESQRRLLSGLILKGCWNKVFIPRVKMFYSKNILQRFPGNHIMQKTPASQNGARQLIKEIFINSVQENNRKTAQKLPTPIPKTQSTNKTNKAAQNPSSKIPQERLPQRYANMQSLFQRLLSNHKSCKFLILLDHHCPLSSCLKKQLKERRRLKGCLLRGKQSKRNARGVFRKQKKLETSLCKIAIKSHTQLNQVVSFVLSVCNRVLPENILGSVHNKKQFYMNITKFLTLRRYDKFSLAQLMHGIKITDCKWTCKSDKATHTKSESESIRNTVVMFVWWFVMSYIIPLLRYFFYITESGATRNKVLYYCRPVWKIINDSGMKEYAGKIYKPLKYKDAIAHVTREKSLGFSHLRFIPKTSSVRPLVNMAYRDVRAASTQVKKPLSVNMKLDNLFHVMNFEKACNVFVTSSVFGHGDVHTRFKPFALQYREKPIQQPLFFVKLDIQSCYNSIPQQKLLDIMSEILQEEEYVIRRFTVITKGTITGDAGHKVYRKSVGHSEDCRTFGDFALDFISKTDLKNALITDQVHYGIEDKEDLLQMLDEHLCNNVTKIQGKFYHQTQGIPQGSVISTLLCNFFYETMEQEHFSEILTMEDSLFLRWVDDYIFITTQQKVAHDFVLKMSRGIPEYGCVINKDKSLANFEVLDKSGQTMCKMSEALYFPWCGFLINTISLEVLWDYSTYEGIHMKNTITIDQTSHAGLTMKKKLEKSMRSRCLKLLLDSDVNSLRTLQLNIYQISMLIAHKFHSYTSALPTNRQADNNTGFFMSVIKSTGQCLFIHVKHTGTKASSNKTKYSRMQDAQWLYFKAFHKILTKKQSKYNKLLELIDKELHKIETGNIDKAELEMITGLSSTLEKLKS